MMFYTLRVGVFVTVLFLGILHAQDPVLTDSRGEPVPDFLMKKISIDLEGTPLPEALAKISDMGRFYLNFSADIVPNDHKVTIRLEDAPVAMVLHKILQDTDIGFVVSNGGQIVLVKSGVVRANIKYTISGFITDAQTGEALIGTNVFTQKLESGCSTNNYGFYSMTLPVGNYTFHYSYMGYETKKIEVNLDHNLRHDIELKTSPILGDSVIVQAEAEEDFVKTTEMGTIKLIPKEDSRIPVLLGEQDIFRTLQLLPGVSQTREGDCGFYVRGGNSDQNLVLLDEAPVYNAYHLLGSFSVFNSDAIREVKLIKGSAPPRYGGKLSSVLDIQMKEGNMKEFRGEAGIGLIFSRITLEGPLAKDNASFMISGRRTYADILVKLFSKETLKDSRLYFYDFNVKTNYRLSERDRIYLSGYFGRDIIGVEGENANDDDVTISWGNNTGTLRWNHLFNDKLFSNLSLIYSRFKYSAVVSSAEDDDVDMSSLINDVTIKDDLQFYLNPENSFNFGLYYSHHTYQPSRILISGDENIDFIIGKRRAQEMGAYISHEWEISDKLKLDYGFRSSLFSVKGKKDLFTLDEMNELPNEFWDIEFHGSENKLYTGLEPRLTVNYLLNRSTSWKLGYSRNYQNVHQLSTSTSGTPLDVWHPSSSKVKPQRADQISLGYFRNYEDKNIEMSVEIFYKDMRHQIDLKDGADIYLSSLFESEVAFGKGWAYGAELFLKKRVGRLIGWIGYTWSRSKRQFDEINNGKSYPARNDRIHDIAIVGMYELSPKWTFSANWIYQTGTPVTIAYGSYILDGQVLEAYSSRNAYRMPAYHRLDIGFTYKTHNKGTWNFSLYNAYGRKNAYAILFEESDWNPVVKEPTRLALFSFVPSITYSFKF
jgi:hypothetical protein